MHGPKQGNSDPHEPRQGIGGGGDLIAGDRTTYGSVKLWREGRKKQVGA